MNDNVNKRVFVTGGAGYIGSHTCLELIKKNYKVMVFDNLCNGSDQALQRVELIANKRLCLVIGDVRDRTKLDEAMQAFEPTSILHFAGLKAVGDSVNDPLRYYDVNVTGSINVLRSMEKIGCKQIVFSSSATVYSEQNVPPFKETDVTSPISPYGRSKLIVENILADWAVANDQNRAVVLRYFNPVGAHSSGLIGEDPKGIPNNLMPMISQVAQKKREHLLIFGDDYSTRDGTGERDYIHVVDLAVGHVKAIEQILCLERFQILNLGSGHGTTVRELVSAFEKNNEVPVPTIVVGRRNGDVAKSYANADLARKLIGFECSKSIHEMCSDTWNWQVKNPNGYN